MIRLTATLALLLLTAPARADAPRTQIPLPFDAVADTAGAERIAVTLRPGITDMRQIAEVRLRVLRGRMHRGVPVPSAGLRALADRGDGLAAQRYVQRLAAEPLPRRNHRLIAQYAAIAVGSGRVWTLDEMIASMRFLDPAGTPGWLRTRLMQVLYAHAWAGNTRALRAVEEFNGPGTLFGPMSRGTRDRLIAVSSRAGDGQVALRLALRALEAVPEGETLTPAGARDLDALLTRAEAAEPLGAQVAARTLRALSEARLP